MSISRDTFDPAKNYKRIRYHQDRDLLDSELNEQQELINLERRKIADILFKEGSILSGLDVTVLDNVLTLTPGMIYIDGHVEGVAGATLTYDPATTSGADYVYAELLKYNYGYTQDPSLINPATGEPTGEREKWVLALKTTDTTGLTLPNNVTERKVVPIYKFARETGDVTATVQEKSNLYLRDLLGTLPGSRITVSSITGSSGVWEKNNVSLFREENKTFGKTADDLRRTLEMPSGKGVHGINGFLPADAGPPHLYVNALASGPFQSATSS
jgi:hypothetical protein